MVGCCSLYADVVVVAVVAMCLQARVCIFIRGFREAGLLWEYRDVMN